MRRELIVNWHQNHLALRDALQQGIKNPLEVLDTGKGWSYVTFFQPGPPSTRVLFDIDELENLAEQNGFFLPREVVSQHNKIVITATSALPNPSAQLFGLHKFMEVYAEKFQNVRKHRQAGYYGKLGGFYERPEKGRVLVMYSTDDDGLLDVMGKVETLIPKIRVPGIHFQYHLSNGLSDIPRMLDGFDDPEYEESGANVYRITDPQRFTTLLDQARDDYHKYMFDKPASL